MTDFHCWGCGVVVQADEGGPAPRCPTPKCGIAMDRVDRLPSFSTARPSGALFTAIQRQIRQRYGIKGW